MARSIRQAELSRIYNNTVTGLAVYCMVLVRSGWFSETTDSFFDSLDIRLIFEFLENLHVPFCN